MKECLHTHLLTWKPLVSLYFIFIRTMTDNTKPKLQGINVVTALLSPALWAVQLLHGWMPYSQMLCMKGEDEAGCSGEQKSNRASSLGVCRSNVSFWMSTFLWTVSQYHCNHVLIWFKKHDRSVKFIFFIKTLILRLCSGTSFFQSIFQFYHFTDK